jgi:L-iditol 2-dehydrogenase
MRAVRIDGPGRVEFADVAEPVPEPGEVIVRVEAAALCATDRRMATLGTHAPRIPGHEIGGTLDDGTAVGIHPNLGCGRCAWCAQGLENRCADHVDIGIQRDGGLAERVAVPRSHVVALDGFSTERAPSVEPLACCLYAVSLLDVRAGDLAIVVGAGTLGIVAMWSLQAAGAKVAVVQRSQERRALAAELGADVVLGPQDDPAHGLGGQPRVALVTAPGSEALAWALERVDLGGRVHAFAGTPGGTYVDANLVHYRHLTLMGSTGSTVEDYRRGLELAREGTIPLERLPSRTVPLEEIPGILLSPELDPRTLRFVARP